MNKKQALYILSDLVESAKSGSHDKNLMVIPELPEFSDKELMDMEYKTIGMYISFDPLDKYKEALDLLTPIGELSESSDSTNLPIIGGRVVTYKQITTKKGQEMAFLTLEDYTGFVEVVVFPNLFKFNKEILGENKILKIKGKVETSSYLMGETEVFTNKVIADRIAEMQEIKRMKSITVYLDDSSNIPEIKETITNNIGNIPIDICYNNKLLMKTSFRISIPGIDSLVNLIQLEKQYE